MKRRPKEPPHQAAGSRSRIFIAETDANRHIGRRLSGPIDSMEEALDCLRWIRRRNRDAAIVLVHEFIEVLK